MKHTYPGPHIRDVVNTKHFFTPREANKTLPLVKKIVSDILTTGRRIRQLSRDLGDNFDDNHDVMHLMNELHELLTELDNIGCEYKDFNFSVGLVDFPSIIDDEDVLLCWRSDEPELNFYHGIHTGYAGRRRIPAKYLN